MTVLEQLDELEECLERVNDHLDDNEYEAARDEAAEIGEKLDCPLCKGLENGVIGGIMFIAGMTPTGRDRRSEAVQAEIDRFLNYELPAARERLAKLDGAEIEPGP